LLQAQIVEKQLKNDGLFNARTQQTNDTLSLPFWDDFSQTIGTIDSAKWLTSEAKVNQTIAINPPSLGVLVFDGLNAQNSPHNASSLFLGDADSIVSKIIDLSKVPENRKNTVWFSFFWQIRGLGEIPDVVDSLTLQFKVATGGWRTVWSVTGGLQNVDSAFRQEMLQLNRQEYFHSGFQFRFKAFSRLTGPFDHFLVDYVYLNEGRNAQDIFYFDRALSSIPSYILQNYSAVPIKQFISAPTTYIKAPNVTFNNLDNQLQPVDFSVVVKDRLSGELIDSVNSRTVVNPVPQGLERRTITANTPNVSTWPTDVDSLYLETLIYISSGDQVRNGVDFRVNDTVRTSFTLHDYFAYDDGTAEFAAGINQARGQLMVQYFAPVQDKISHIDIHFPQIAPLSNGQPIELLVMNSLDNVIGSLIAKQPGTVRYADSENGFVSYPLEIPISVKDTFYIGFRQFTDNFIGVGLDKNNDNKSRIFANVLGTWERNDRVEGSLMIRPRFSKITNTVTSVEKIPASSLFPNPASHILNIHAENMGEVYLMDLSGKTLAHYTNLRNKESIILPNLPNGIYLVKIVKNDAFETHKIIISK
jgi:hypothetical protein